ncbi:hypothetical protein [Nocardia vinacea]|uniref:hypothetical protein n=1 Tax=Nocardia vinacea TaxID=96468 RepID=UPI0002D9C14E|nr:hypothetical protein [Nocardia vinacea]
MEVIVDASGVTDPTLTAAATQVSRPTRPHRRRRRRGCDPPYAQAYAARAIPLGAALLFSLTNRRKRALLPLLAMSGVVQLGDVAIGAIHGIPGMMPVNSTQR